MSYYRTGDEENETVHSDTESTVPLSSDSELIYELHAASDYIGRNTGWGWHPSTGEMLLSDLTDPSDADVLDFYVSDLAEGWQEADYYLVSPSSGPSIEAVNQNSDHCGNRFLMGVLL